MHKFPLGSCWWSPSQRHPERIFHEIHYSQSYAEPQYNVWCILMYSGQLQYLPVWILQMITISSLGGCFLCFRIWEPSTWQFTNHCNTPQYAQNSRTQITMQEYGVEMLPVSWAIETQGHGTSRCRVAPQVIGAGAARARAATTGVAGAAATDGMVDGRAMAVARAAVLAWARLEKARGKGVGGCDKWCRWGGVEGFEVFGVWVHLFESFCVPYW